MAPFVNAVNPGLLPSTDRMLHAALDSNYGSSAINNLFGCGPLSSGCYGGGGIWGGNPWYQSMANSDGPQSWVAQDRVSALETYSDYGFFNSIWGRCCEMAANGDLGGIAQTAGTFGTLASGALDALGGLADLFSGA